MRVMSDKRKAPPSAANHKSKRVSPLTGLNNGRVRGTMRAMLHQNSNRPVTLPKAPWEIEDEAKERAVFASIRNKEDTP